MLVSSRHHFNTFIAYTDNECHNDERVQHHLLPAKANDLPDSLTPWIQTQEKDYEGKTTKEILGQAIENFRMCKTNFSSFCSELHEYIQREEIIMRATIDVERRSKVHFEKLPMHLIWCFQAYCFCCDQKSSSCYCYISRTKIHSATFN